MKNKHSIKKIFVLAAILPCLLILFSETSAQNTRRQRTTNPQPVVSPTVQPRSTAPVVVSRSDQYIDGNQIVLSPMQPNQIIENQIENDNLTEANVSETETRIEALNARIKSLETGNRNNSDEKQKRLLLNLDILSRAEQRSESLRKQLFEMIEKENNVQARMEQIQVDLRSENIERSTAMIGSLRPEEIRDQRRRSLEAERRNLESLLTQIQTSRASLEDSVQKADFLVERVRLKLDKEIDAALADEDNP